MRADRAGRRIRATAGSPAWGPALLVAGFFLPGLPLPVLAQTQAGTRPAPDVVASTAPEVKVLAGVWDIVAGARRCRIQLNGAQPGRDTLVAGIQPTCRAAIPALAPVLSWGLSRNGHLLLLTGEGKPALDFTATRDAGGMTRFSAGDLLLEPVGQRYEPRTRETAIAAAIAATRGATSSGPSADPALGAASGRYLIAREKGQPGCAVTLGLEATTLEKARRATLDPGCVDQGLKVFDPAGWRLEGERLFLVARKGHSIGFTRQRDGSYIKDPPQGRPLVMVKT